MNDKNHLFFSTFVTEYVNIITDKIMPIANGDEIISMPLIAEGYLVDVDDEYLYIGSDKAFISKAVKISCVVEVEITEKPSIYTQILDDMQLPSKEEDFN